MTNRTKSVRRNSDDPIGDLLESGWTYPSLAAAWGLSSDSTVRKMRTFNHIPRAPLAAKIAATLGWSSAGDVVDTWLKRKSA